MLDRFCAALKSMGWIATDGAVSASADRLPLAGRSFAGSAYRRTPPQRILLSGASSGLGRALAVELAGRGSRLVLNARRESELNETAASCRDAGAAEVRVVTGDIGVTGEAERIVRAAQEAFGGLDVVIANAGISRDGPAEEITGKDLDDVFAVNFFGASKMALAALPDMIAQGSGRIVGISSVAAYRGLPGSAVYCASKAALTTFLESMRPELAKKGVAVTVVAPGFMNTPMTEKNPFPMPLIMTPEKAARIIANGLERGKREIAFPWSTATLMRVVQVLPAALLDFVFGRFAPEMPKR